MAGAEDHGLAEDALRYGCGAVEALVPPACSGPGVPCCQALQAPDPLLCCFLSSCRKSFRPAEHISLRGWELRIPLTSVIVSGE